LQARLAADPAEGEIFWQSSAYFAINWVFVAYRSLDGRHFQRAYVRDRQ
jgi:hypothetical protein